MNFQHQISGKNICSYQYHLSLVTPPPEDKQLAPEKLPWAEKERGSSSRSIMIHRVCLFDARVPKHILPKWGCYMVMNVMEQSVKESQKIKSKII